MKLSEEIKASVCVLKKYLDSETEEIERGKLFGESYALEKILPKIEQLEKENEELKNKCRECGKDRDLDYINISVDMK